MSKFKTVIGWIATIFFGLLVFSGFFSGIFFLILTLLVLPIPKWQKFKKEKLKLGTGLSILIGVIVFFIGGSLIPSSDETETPDTSSSIVETQESTTENTTEPSTENATEETTTVTTTTTVETTTSTETTTTTETIPEDSTFSVQFIDVGQADAALIECDGHYMLIDGGNVGDSSRMYSILSQKDIQNLDIVVGTHAHEDHIGGLAGALNYATVDLVLSPVLEYDSEAFHDFKSYAEKNGNGLTVPSVGDTYELGSADIEILGVNGGSDANNTSIVLRIEYGETSFLFTGDSEREAEQAILNRGADLSATVLKVGHHGSDTSTSYVWLDAILPEYAIVSVGEGNSYEHPTDAVLSRLHDAEVTTYRTDLNGDIFAVSDGKTVTITTDKTASEDEIFTPGTIIVETQLPTVVTESQTDAPVEDTPVGMTYILNTNTKKFHYPGCGSANKIKESNRSEFYGTRDELIAMGYSPCGNCDP